MKIASPSGFFRVILDLLGSPRAPIAGGLFVLQGALLSQFSVLGWTLQAADLCFSIGFSLLLASTLRIAVSGRRIMFWRYFLLAGAFGMVLTVLQMSAGTAKGLVRVTDRPAETITVQTSGGAVQHHLGGPLKIVQEIDDNNQPQSQLAFGIDSKAVSRLPDECCRSKLGPWFVERLGLDFRDASLTVDVSIRYGDVEPQRVRIQPGGVHGVNETLSVRLASLTAMPTSEGHRLIFEIIDNGMRTTRTVYSALPKLDERLGAKTPQFEIHAIERAPVHQMLVYRVTDDIWHLVALGLGLLLMSTGHPRRDTCS